jgi:hypothetical protein
MWTSSSSIHFFAKRQQMRGATFGGENDLNYFLGLPG